MEYSKEKVLEYYKYVLQWVELGCTIEKACKKAGVCRSVFYKYISNYQKTEIRMAKTSHAIHRQNRNR